MRNSLLHSIFSSSSFLGCGEPRSIMLEGRPCSYLSGDTEI